MGGLRWSHLLILVSLSGPFSFASRGFASASPLIIKCSALWNSEKVTEGGVLPTRNRGQRGWETNSKPAGKITLFSWWEISRMMHVSPGHGLETGNPPPPTPPALLWLEMLSQKWHESENPSLVWATGEQDKERAVPRSAMLQRTQAPVHSQAEECMPQARAKTLLEGTALPRSIL